MVYPPWAEIETYYPDPKAPPWVPLPPLRASYTLKGLVLPSGSGAERSGSSISMIAGGNHTLIPNLPPVSCGYDPALAGDS